MSLNKYAESEGFLSDKDRRKRLGQYYSGAAVARFLAALSLPDPCRNVIDPMAGKGDMLAAAIELKSGQGELHGIEIDSTARKQCDATAALLQTESYACYPGSAFDPSVVRRLSASGYDLVITNPPYVRYQALRESAGRQTHLPSALEVRNGLRECIKSSRILDVTDKRLFDTLITAYSGFSDLAVPSWILCSALVRLGGRLAIVVPDAWLNRDYSAVIQYLLMRWFRIEFIVEDEHAVWFPDAQVKTTLLVAKRIARVKSIQSWRDESYLHISIPAFVSNSKCLVGRASAQDENANVAFAKAARRLLAGSSNILVDGVSWQRILLSDRSRAVFAMGANSEWLKVLEPKLVAERISQSLIPPALADWYRGFVRFSTLERLGIHASQGLRTGANEFFYAEEVAKTGGVVEIRLSKLFANKRLKVPFDCLLPVVRKQRDLSCGLVTHARFLKGRVFALQGYGSSKALPAHLGRHIRRAAQTRMPSGVLIPRLSAVAPNARPKSSKAGAHARFWYMLPDFGDRHRPDLFIARVNSERPFTYINRNRGALVDANFSTLWLAPSATVTVTSVFAFLNSSIAVALYEYAGSVMGGGALKLESTHLRSIPIPNLSTSSWERLDLLGQQLINSSVSTRTNVIHRIDREICTDMFGSSKVAAKLKSLQSVIVQRQSARIRRAKM